MSGLTFNEFGGIAPLLQPTKLADPMGVIAENTRFDSGGITSWNGAVDVVPLAASVVNSLFYYGYTSTWLASANKRQYVGALLPNDVWARIYYTDGTSYPKIRSGTSEYRLGLPRPAAPVAVITTPGNMTSIIDVRQQSYVVTFVDKFGLEGPPSVPTASLEVGEGGVVALDLTLCVLTGNYNMGVGSFLRIYRTNTASDGSAVFQYAVDVAYGTVLYADSLPGSALQEALQSQNWVAAPDDDGALYPGGPLASLVQVPGGVLAGHSGNTVYLSEPYVPSAWPYSYSFSETVVGLAVIQGGILVCTGSRPILLTGGSPDALAEIPIESSDGCVSARSIVDMGDFAIYASPRGLVGAEGNTATLLTQDLINASGFSALCGDFANFRAYRYQGKYIAFTGAGAAGTGFIFDPTDRSLCTFTGIPCSAATNTGPTADVGAANLYLAEPRSGAHEVVKFNAGTPLTYRWKSRVFTLADIASFGVLRVRAGTYPVSVTLLSDGVTRGPYSIPSSAPVKIPGGYRAGVWQVTVQGTGFLESVQLANSLMELSE